MDWELLSVKICCSISAVWRKVFRDTRRSAGDFSDVRKFASILEFFRNASVLYVD